MGFVSALFWLEVDPISFTTYRWLEWIRVRGFHQTQFGGYSPHKYEVSISVEMI